MIISVSELRRNEFDDFLRVYREIDFQSITRGTRRVVLGVPKRRRLRILPLPHPFPFRPDNSLHVVVADRRGKRVGTDRDGERKRERETAVSACDPNRNAYRVRLAIHKKSALWRFD